MHKEWVFIAEHSDCRAAARRWGVPPLVAQILLNRGLAPDASAHEFLSPQMRSLHPPEMLPGATEAAERIVDAARRGTNIVLYGDYDVDGTTGIAILWHVLSAAGANVSFYVPHRVEEGYGLNLDAVKRLMADGAGMIISVDCGITAVDVADTLQEKDVSLIITDHHQPPETLPVADVIVHPALDDTYPNENLAGAGVAFKLAWAIAQRLSGSERVAPELRELLLHLLPLAALGTIADVVPLKGENRIIARHGLERLRQIAFAGPRALMENAGLLGEKISAYDVGFKLAPRINAAGRMGHARLAVELLTSADEARAREIALYLDDHNRSRQSTERAIFRQACKTIEDKHLAGDARRAIVVANEGWHSGVIGIVASRIVDRYHRPAILIATDNGEGQGSGRSIQRFDLHGALKACSNHLISFGGHRMAAGLRIAVEQVPAFTKAFVEVANNRLTGSDLSPRLRLDAEVSLGELTLPTAEVIAGLGPFGVGNPRPRLASGWVTLASEPRCVGQEGKHLQATFVDNGTQLKAIGFGLASLIEDLKQHRRCRVAFEPIINDFNGRRSVEMRVLDFAFPPH